MLCMSVRVALWFLLCFCSSAILPVPVQASGTGTGNKRYTTHFFLTQKLSLDNPDQDAGSESASGSSIRAAATSFRFEDSRGNLILLSQEYPDSGTLMRGGAILSSGTAWIGAGPGKLAGAAACLSGLLPNTSVPMLSIPFSLAPSLDSSTFLTGLGTRNLAVFAAKKEEAGTSFGNLCFVASGGEDNLRAALSFAAIAKDARFPLLGWRPAEAPDPAEMVFRMAAGISALLEKWEFELRSAISAGRILSPGCGLGGSVSFSENRFRLMGGFALSNPEIRDYEGKRARNLAELQAGLNFRGKKGSVLSFRTKMELSAERNEVSDQIVEEGEDDTDSEGVAETVSDGESPVWGSAAWWKTLQGWSWMQGAGRLALCNSCSFRLPLRAGGQESQDSDEGEEGSSLLFEISTSGTANSPLKDTRAALGFTRRTKAGWGENGLHAGLSMRRVEDARSVEGFSAVASGSLGADLKYPFRLRRDSRKNHLLSIDLTIYACHNLANGLLPGKGSSFVLDISSCVEHESGAGLTLGIKLKESFATAKGAEGGESGGRPSLAIFLTGAVETGH